ncbi:MAG: DUF4331 family protein [Ferruginibacter sp.]
MKRKIYAAFMLFVMATQITAPAFASSHREAPLIANDPLADNTDVYAFRSPDNPNKITIIANYVPGQLPQGGPNYYSFGENIRYEIHIDNNVGTKGDDIVYRFTFKKTNEDPTTFFNIRLGQQNLKTTYRMERSMDGGKTFQIVLHNGVVPPTNIGPRSISTPVGLNAPDYNTLINKAISTSKTGEKVFCGTADDPFFVDLGGIFDLGDAPRTTGTKPVDGLKCLNVSTIALQIDISTLQKDHKPASQCTNILDPNYVIGVWASASRHQIRVLNEVDPAYLSTLLPDPKREYDLTREHGKWIQVSRLGMPLTNEAVVPIGYKDLWNALTPYDDLATIKLFGNYFYNPELALYMDKDKFGDAIPALAPLRIQKNSLGSYGFGNGQDGLYSLKGSSTLTGTALDDAIFGTLLLPAKGSPRSVDLYPIFNTGVPNLSPYQLAVGKPVGNPLAKGKPFINNFLPNGGDMLRLNMAVPPTDRNSNKFSSLGLLQAAALGLTDPAYNTTTAIQFIPNMDGFPNGRRLEDDVTRIELQAVSGIVLAVLGLWYDDFTPGGSHITPRLLDVLTYSTGIEANDVPFKKTFPYVQSPFPGNYICPCDQGNNQKSEVQLGNSIDRISSLGLAAPEVIATTSPNPVVGSSTIKYRLDTYSKINISLYDVNGNQVKVLVNKTLKPGTYTQDWNGGDLMKGMYFIKITKDGIVKQSLKVVKAD